MLREGITIVTLFDAAQRFVGNVKEITGDKGDPFIVWCLQSCDAKITSDEVPWCSGFINRLAWFLRLWRSKSLAARSWLTGGIPITLAQAEIGNDIVILKRGKAPQPGPDVLKAPGHVGVFAGLEDGFVLILGGNQSNGVTIARFPISDVLGVRRLTAV